MAEAVGICKNKPEECKSQLSALEKKLDGQIKARQQGDSWQKAHLANATALVNLHIRNDIKGDVTEDDAIEHMKGDVCQMQIVESVWSLHDFIAAKKRACFSSRMEKLKADVTRCFEGTDKTAVLSKTKNLEDHFAKNEEAEFDVDFDALIKVILDLSVQTHESPNVAPAYCAESGMVGVLKSMTQAVGICKNNPQTCKVQLGALEKKLDGQIKARQQGDSWQKAHLANATALVNLHIRNDIKGDVTEDDAIEHMKGDVCQMQIVESVWSLHDFIAAKKRACFSSRMEKLKADVTRCFEGTDKTAVL